jgi:hypothetical protein
MKAVMVLWQVLVVVAAAACRCWWVTHRRAVHSAQGNTV